MVSIDTGFMAVLVSVLLCHGYEVDLNKREKRKKEKEAQKQAKYHKKLRDNHTKETIHFRRKEAAALAEYRRRSRIPEDFIPPTVEEMLRRERVDFY